MHSSYPWLVREYVNTGFVILICGTLVYKEGDKHEGQQEMEEAIALNATEEPGGSDDLPTPSIPTPIAAVSTPMNMAPGSFRASHTIMSGSYHRGSMVGAVPHMIGSLKGRGQGGVAGSLTGRGYVVTHGASQSDEENEE